LLLGIIKIILLWWIITVVIRWYRRLQSDKSNRQSFQQNGNNDIPKDQVFTGKIEDAEFEDLDDRK
jgi:hypothetical protein